MYLCKRENLSNQKQEGEVEVEAEGKELDLETGEEVGHLKDLKSLEGRVEVDQMKDLRTQEEEADLEVKSTEEERGVDQGTEDDINSDNKLKDNLY